MSPGGRTRRWAGRLLLAGLLAVAAVAAARELRERLRYVSETDARITADLVTLSSRVDGWLEQVPVTEGEQVERAQVLARVDDRGARLRLRALEARQRALDADRVRLLAERELVDQRTRAQHQTQRAALAGAQASMAALEAQRELARSELARARSLRASNVIAEQQLEQARAAARRLEGDYATATAGLDTARARVAEAQAERARVSVLDGELGMLAHRHAALEAELEQSRLELADHQVRSPLSGVVDRVFVQAGEYVSPGQRLLIVHDPRRVWVEANIKETAIRRLAPGQRVRLRVDAFPGRDFAGELLAIGDATTGSFALLPNPNPSGNFTKVTQRLPVRIRIEGSDGRLRPGMMVEVRIDAGGR